ncbi:MAG: hypothetical protein R3E44_05120 [Paracoccaceae bacterium]
MTITHTDTNVRDRMTLPHANIPLSEFTSFGDAARVRVARMAAAFERRLMMRRIARFSDHRLQDIGFERDWDGSINPVTPDPRLPWSKAS